MSSEAPRASSRSRSNTMRTPNNKSTAPLPDDLTKRLQGIQVNSLPSPGFSPHHDSGYLDPGPQSRSARPSVDAGRWNGDGSPSPSHVASNYGMRSASLHRPDVAASPSAQATPSRSRTQRRPNDTKPSPIPPEAPLGPPASGLPPPRRTRAMTIQGGGKPPTIASPGHPKRPPSWIEYPDLETEVLRLKAREAEKRAQRGYAASESSNSAVSTDDEPLVRHPTVKGGGGGATVSRSATNAGTTANRPPRMTAPPGTIRAVPKDTSAVGQPQSSGRNQPRPSLPGISTGGSYMQYPSPGSAVPRTSMGNRTASHNNNNAGAIPPTPLTPSNINTPTQSYFQSQQPQSHPPPSSSPPANGVGTAPDPTAEPYRIYIESKQQYVKVAIGAKTTAGDVLRMVKDSGQLLPETKGSGEGAMLWEIASDFGMGTSMKANYPCRDG